MKYTAKFEEMIDARNQAIENLKKVINEQDKLLKYLSKDEEGKKEFDILIKSIDNDIKNKQKTILEMSSQNQNTIFIVNKIKKADAETTKFIQDIIKELGIFEESEQKENQKPEKTNNKK